MARLESILGRVLRPKSVRRLRAKTDGTDKQASVSSFRSLQAYRPVLHPQGERLMALESARRNHDWGGIWVRTGQ